MSGIDRSRSIDLQSKNEEMCQVSTVLIVGENNWGGTHEAAASYCIVSLSGTVTSQLAAYGRHDAQPAHRLDP